MERERGAQEGKRDLHTHTRTQTHTHTHTSIACICIYIYIYTYYVYVHPFIHPSFHSSFHPSIDPSHACCIDAPTHTYAHLLPTYMHDHAGSQPASQAGRQTNMNAYMHACIYLRIHA